MISRRPTTSDNRPGRCQAYEGRRNGLGYLTGGRASNTGPISVLWQDGRRLALPTIMNAYPFWVKQDAPPGTPAGAVPAQPETGEVVMSSTSHSPSTRCIESVTWSL